MHSAVAGWHKGTTQDGTAPPCKEHTKGNPLPTATRGDPEVVFMLMTLRLAHSKNEITLRVMTVRSKYHNITIWLK